MYYLIYLSVCFQEEMQQVSYGELTDLQLIGEGGYGEVYRAKHARFGTVVYKELKDQILGERYAYIVLV